MNRPPRPKSKLYRNPEVEAFVNECLDRRLIYREIHRLCLERFGEERTPSVNAISRHYMARGEPAR